MRKIIILLAVLVLAGCGNTLNDVVLSAPAKQQTFEIGRNDLAKCLNDKIYNAHGFFNKMGVGIQSLDNETILNVGRFVFHYQFSLIGHGKKTEVVLKVADSNSTKEAWQYVLECTG